MGMYGSRAVTLLVLISDDVINRILKLDIQTSILVYVTRCCTDLTSKVLKERTFCQSSALLKCVLLKDHNTVTPVRLKPAASRSRVKHSTTEPLRSLNKMTKFVRVHVSSFYWSRDTRQILFTCVKVTKTFKILNL